MKSTNVKRLRNIMRICLLLVGVIVIGGSLFSIKSSAENNENYDVDSALIINDENDE